ncbi:MAG: hypothetical protein AABZ57_01520, partial [Candidatus Margulisiibacteriota bacterium]
SIADLLPVVYMGHMRFDPRQPKHPDRDRFVLSKGHGNPALYSMLALSGFFPRTDLFQLQEGYGFRQIKSHLQGHPDMWRTPGVDFSTGRLGAGFAAAVGIAVAGIMQNKDYHTYVCLGDGELQEGVVTEVAERAPKFGLGNLTAFIDLNDLQIDGSTSDVSNVNIPGKWLDMGWSVIQINGHDPAQIDYAIDLAKSSKRVPSAIIMYTIKGKGVSFMEGGAGWHGKAPKGDEVTQALAEIKETVDIELAVAAVERMARKKRLPKLQDAEQPQGLKIALKPWERDQATRNTFGEWLVAAMKRDKRIIAFDADLAKSVMTDQAEKEFGVFNSDRNGRVIRAGVSEAGMFGIGAGLSASGLYPIMATFARFTIVATDILDQTFGKNHLSGLIIGTHAGLQVAEDGPSHMDITSLRILGSIPGINVYEPGDPKSAASLLTQAFNSGVPSYLRFTRSPIPYIKTKEGAVAEQGYRILRPENISEGLDDHIIILAASGAMVGTAFAVANLINGTKEYEAAVTRIVDIFAPTDFARLGGSDRTIFDHCQVVATMIDATPETLAEPVQVHLFKAELTPDFISFGARAELARSGKIDDVYREQGLLPEQIAEAIMLLWN